MNTPTPIPARTFPSIFQAWNGVTQTDLGGEDSDATLARHDLWFCSPEQFGLYWAGRMGLTTAASLAETFEPESIVDGLAKRAKLKVLNPNIILLSGVGYTEADPDYAPDFPENHPWWKRDTHGNRMLGWGEGTYQSYLFNLALSEVRQHCANQCAALMATGVLDGIMLDVFSNDAHHVDILHRIRALLPNALIIVNGRQRVKTNNSLICPDLAPLVNGFYMEVGHGRTKADWDKITAALDYNEKHVRAPKLNCLELWYTNGRDDFALMRAITCLSLTHSDGYAVFTEPNSLLAPDHQHSWYRFWNKTLGVPIGKLVIGQDGMHQRAYENGIAVFNPPNNPNNKVVNLDTPKKSVVSETISDRFLLGSPDGGIYLNL